MTGGAGGACPSPADLSQEWARTIAAGGEVAIPTEQLQTRLRGLVERLLAAIAAPSTDLQAAAEVGTQLVAAGLTGAQTLLHTFHTLGAALLPAAGTAGGQSPCSRVIEVLGALAEGYTSALRQAAEYDLQKKPKTIPATAGSLLPRYRD